MTTVGAAAPAAGVVNDAAGAYKVECGDSV